MNKLVTVDGFTTADIETVGAKEQIRLRQVLLPVGVRIKLLDGTTGLIPELVAPGETNLHIAFPDQLEGPLTTLGSPLRAENSAAVSVTFWLDYEIYPR